MIETMAATSARVRTCDENELHLDRSQILESNDHLHTHRVYDDTENGGFSLFFRMMEWMEIESSIAKSFDELVAMVKHAKHEREIIQNVDPVLDELDTLVHSKMNAFFDEISFTCGVLNFLAVVYIFGAYPQHFWILYLVEGLYLLPKNLCARTAAKPMNRIFTYLDCCWVMNSLALLSLVALVLHSMLPLPVPEAGRKQLYVWAVGTSCGTLMGAAITLPFVALLFHDLNSMCGLFIHVFPPMVAYTLRWHAAEMREAWPSVFSLNYLDEIRFFPDRGMSFLGTVAGNTVTGYVLWCIPYVIWMLLIGLNLPRKDRVAADGTLITPKYDTCFNVAMRGGGCITIGKVFWRRSERQSLKQMEANHFETRDFLVYMVMHACGAMFSILVLGYSCYSNQIVHMALLVFVAVLCTSRGARRYTYYSRDMYSLMLRKHFAVLRQVSSNDELTRESKKAL